MLDSESCRIFYSYHEIFAHSIAFVCHHNTYLIYGSLRQRSLTRFSIVSHISVSASFVFCIVLGLAGFLTVLGETRGEKEKHLSITRHPWDNWSLSRFKGAVLTTLG